jgi:cytidyltransferase-like protein
MVANGVFDGLHAGHQRVLTHCKQGREVLVVGLNSDESVAKLGRTTFASCEERARAIAQLRRVI